MIVVYRRQSDQDPLKGLVSKQLSLLDDNHIKSRLKSYFAVFAVAARLYRSPIFWCRDLFLPTMITMSQDHGQLFLVNVPYRADVELWSSFQRKRGSGCLVSAITRSLDELLRGFVVAWMA